MNKLFLCLASTCLMGCVIDSSNHETQDAKHIYSNPHIINDDIGIFDSDTALVTDILSHIATQCITETFMANAIPPGYILTAECPPKIIWPPKFILPNDPLPFIK